MFLKLLVSEEEIPLSIKEGSILFKMNVIQILKNKNCKKWAWENESASSVDPDEMGHTSHLIWIYTAVQTYYQLCSVVRVNVNVIYDARTFLLGAKR